MRRLPDALNQADILPPDYRLAELGNGPEQEIAARLAGMGPATALRVQAPLNLGRPDRRPDRAPPPERLAAEGCSGL